MVGTGTQDINIIGGNRFAENAIRDADIRQRALTPDRTDTRGAVNTAAGQYNPTSTGYDASGVSQQITSQVGNTQSGQQVLNQTPGANVFRQLETALGSDSPYMRQTGAMGEAQAARAGLAGSTAGIRAAQGALIAAAAPLVQTQAQIGGQLAQTGMQGQQQRQQQEVAGIIQGAQAEQAGQIAGRQAEQAFNIESQLANQKFFANAQQQMRQSGIDTRMSVLQNKYAARMQNEKLSQADRETYMQFGSSISNQLMGGIASLFNNHNLTNEQRQAGISELVSTAETQMETLATVNDWQLDFNL